MKKVILTIFVICFFVIYLQADFPGTEYTWKMYSQAKSGACCGCSDSNRVYWGVEFRFTYIQDTHAGCYKIYNRTDAAQIGYWNDFEGPLSGRVYFYSAYAGVSWFDFQWTEYSYFIFGANDSRNVFCVRGSSI